MHFKIVVVGPKGSGKTLISNMLSGTSSPEKLVAAAASSDSYDPTEGVRILEFELRVHGISDDVNIELWDMSGDSKYEGCWKAAMADSDGTVLIYNVDAPSQEREIADWHDIFVRRNGLKDEQCLLVALKSPQSTEKSKPSALFSKLAGILTTPDKAVDVKSKFETLVKDLYYIKIKK